MITYLFIYLIILIYIFIESFFNLIKYYKKNKNFLSETIVSLNITSVPFFLKKDQINLYIFFLNIIFIYFFTILSIDFNPVFCMNTNTDVNNVNTNLQEQEIDTNSLEYLKAQNRDFYQNVRNTYTIGEENRFFFFNSLFFTQTKINNPNLVLFGVYKDLFEMHNSQIQLFKQLNNSYVEKPIKCELFSDFLITIKSFILLNTNLHEHVYLKIYDEILRKNETILWEKNSNVLTKKIIDNNKIILPNFVIKNIIEFKGNKFIIFDKMNYKFSYFSNLFLKSCNHILKELKKHDSSFMINHKKNLNLETTINSLNNNFVTKDINFEKRSFDIILILKNKLKQSELPEDIQLRERYLFSYRNFRKDYLDNLNTEQITNMKKKGFSYLSREEIDLIEAEIKEKVKNKHYSISGYGK